MAMPNIAKSFKQKKQRTKEEISNDYNQNAVQHGHKTYLIKEIQKQNEAQIESLKTQLAEHLKRMGEIMEESKKLPPEAIPPAQEATTQEEEHA